MTIYGLDEDAPPRERFSRRFQILSLSGGGYRGLFTAAVLEMMETGGSPLQQRFDLITGTSIGSILASAVALGVPAKDIVAGMLKHGTRIFPAQGRMRRMARAVRQFAVSAPYKVGPLEDAIAEILQGKESQLLSEMEQALAIPAVSHTRAAPRILRSKGLARGQSDRVSVMDAMLASAAAPTYFPARRLGKETVVDGGIVANAPEMVAVSDAMRFQNVPLANIHVLSIGTASIDLVRPATEEGRPGTVGWMARRQLFQVTMQAQESLIRDQCAALLGDRYLHINVEPAPAQAKILRLDNADREAKDTLIDLAGQAWSDAQSKHAQTLRAFEN